MQNYPLSIFHASVRPESLPGPDLSAFEKVIFLFFLCVFGPFGPIGPLGPSNWGRASAWADFECLCTVANLIGCVSCCFVQ